ncbi:hypothetical protein [uncultured Desulfuromusa sp.]|uniref:hypothetical protein n=1 Tax=uncultured Desulfuromusa sp. TaxID=219183 RepID=UPI002AA73DEA|nr:hypothetical protein [uncultured Desulfuromusa sp.]
MPVNFSRILIFDDKPEEGIRIAKGLWRAGFSARFIQWDGSIGDSPAENLNGVRIVFMDIDLLNDGNVSESKTFPIIQQALTHFLNSANGPYIMITWTTWAKDSEPLFVWLQERLPKFHKKGIGPLPPIAMHIIDKEKIDELPDEGSKETELKRSIDNYLKELDAIACLTDWEAQIQNAGCETIHSMMSIANQVGSGNANNDLKKTLWSLAKAEGERHLTKNNAQKNLYAVLSQIHFDRTNHNLIPDLDLGKTIMEGSDPDLPLISHSEINTMLHLDYSAGGEMPAPGDVYKYPEQGHGIQIPEIIVEKFLKTNFMDLRTGEMNTEEKKELVQTAKLFLVEITPPCDHAQNKFVWNRFIVAAQIPSKLIQFCWIANNDTSEEGKPRKRFGDKLPDYLWKSPEVADKDGSPFYILYNSRLVISFDYAPGIIGDRQFRIRQPLLSDMVGWLARQNSRIGHLAVAP